jgi:type 2A phosphatase activator TIP41
MCRAEKRLNLPLPEMTFGNNSLLCTYNDGSNEVTMRFNGIEALSEVGVGEGWEERVGGAVLVSMAESWGKNRYVWSSPLGLTPCPHLLQVV